MTAPLPEYVPTPPPQRRKFNRKCSRCGLEVDSFHKHLLVVVRVQFVEMGHNGKVLRSRTKEWLCIPCMEKDPDYNRESHTEAPGFVNAEPAKLRKEEG